MTSSDLSEVTGYTRHQLRGLLNELPSYQAKAERARVARAYTKYDLAVITVCCELEQRYGLRRDVIAALGEQLAQALHGPRAATRDPYLLVTVAPPLVQYVEQMPVGVREGLVVPLSEVFARLGRYLSADFLPGAPEQGALDLGPLPVLPLRRTRSAREKSSIAKTAAGKTASRRGTS
jgi:hypothetical protein